MNVTINGGSYADARETAEKSGTVRRVRTQRIRVIAMPEKKSSKSGNRVYGAERLRPATSGHFIRRTFVLNG